MRMIALVLVMLSGIAQADVARPQVVVTIASSHDESPESADQAARDANRETIRQALLAALRSSPQLTSVAQAGALDQTAQPVGRAERSARGALDRRVDLSVVALHAVEGAHGVELSTELKVVISDASGQILSIVSGGAKAEVSRHAFGSRLPAIRKQLLQDAMQGMFGPLRAHLLRSLPNV
jgi:hypothetical protein